MKGLETWQETIARIPEIPVPKIIDSEPLGQGRFLRTSRKTIQYPNGSVGSWEAVSRPEEVISVLAETSERVLILIAEYRPLIAPRWNISLPAGLVDTGFSKKATCVKELREETGHVGEIVKFLIDTPPSPGGSEEIVSQYFMPHVSVIPGPRELEPTEFIEVLRVPRDEIDILMGVGMERPELFTVDAKIDQALAFARRKGYLG